MTNNKHQIMSNKFSVLLQDSVCQTIITQQAYPSKETVIKEYLNDKHCELLEQKIIDYFLDVGVTSINQEMFGKKLTSLYTPIEICLACIKIDDYINAIIEYQNYLFIHNVGTEDLISMSENEYIIWKHINIYLIGEIILM